MAKRDYYEILGISKDAGEAAIKKAYRGLAMKYHPDKNPGDDQAAERMKEINEAYAVLSDRNKRGLYDTYGHAGLEGYSQEDIFRGVDFGSIFEEIFGGGFGSSGGGGIFDSLFGTRRGGRTRQPQRGSDLRYDLTVSLEDVAFGKEEKIEFPWQEACPICNGAGAKEDGFKECETCKGTGQLVTEQRSGSSIFRQISACSNCRGRGRVITDPCEECEGRGTVEKNREIYVYIPKGADTGHRIKIEGEGEKGAGGNGDLYVILSVQKHPVFERHGDDIYVVKEVDFTKAALGGVLDDVPGLEGDLSLEIPEGTQNGAILRIIDKGIPHLNGYGRGDEYTIIKVLTPTNLTEEEKDLLRRFEESRRQYSVK